MGFLDSVLGGGSQTTKVKIPDYIKTPSQQISQRVGKIFNTQKEDPLGALQDEALAGITGQARAGNPNIGYGNDFLSSLFASGGLNPQQAGLAGGLIGGDIVNPALSETARVAMGGDVGRNPFLDSFFNRAANVVGEQFSQNVIPGLDNTYAQSGRLGSNSYANARNKAEDAYGRQLTDLANQVYGGAYQSDMANKNAALANYGTLGQQGIQNQLQGAGLFQQGTGNLFGAISAIPGLQDLRYDDLSRLFQVGSTQQNAGYQNAQQAADIIGRLQGGSTSTTSQNVNPLGQFIGLGTSIAGLPLSSVGGAGLASLFSDRRLKRDVRRVGRMASGLPLYRYRYTWDGPGVWRTGVMADEAAVRFPAAVTRTGFGYLLVDYGRIA